MAPTMVLGLPSKNVMMANYDDAPYDFAPELKDSFEAFVASDYMKQIRKLGNDLPRYMLTRYGSNFDKENPLLTIQLKKTFWRHCPTMVLGLPSKNVMMANYDDAPYDFAPDRERALGEWTPGGEISE